MEEEGTLGGLLRGLLLSLFEKLTWVDIEPISNIKQGGSVRSNYAGLPRRPLLYVLDADNVCRFSLCYPHPCADCFESFVVEYPSHKFPFQ